MAESRPPAPPPGLLPRHIAIIMDGNGRWARERGLSRIRGHEAGAASVRRVIETCGAWGIEVLTLYAFSTENWRRPRAEVQALMALLSRYLKQEREELHRQGVRLRTIGDPERLPGGVRRELEHTIDFLSGNHGLTLVVALSYGARDEIVRAARALARRCVAGELDPAALTEEDLSRHLDTAGLPDPDLLIRTAGEMRLSNFLLWQVSYTEYYSAPECWPDFEAEGLIRAIQAFQERNRTYGQIKEG